jgi:hypothetical protein
MNMPQNRETTRKLSALRQIRAAIQNFEAGELECAITLAGAAEGQLPDTESPYLLKGLKDHTPFSIFDYNSAINWLKHAKEPDSTTITGHEAAIVLFRAITKFVAVYWQISQEMDAFLEASYEWGFPRPNGPQSKGGPGLAAPLRVPLISPDGEPLCGEKT